MIDVGTLLKGGRWRLDELLAVGGVSTVFAASHRNGSRAAIKVLNVDFIEDTDMRARFLREGYAANKVGHPGVVRVLDDEVADDGRAYLVMELLDGEGLEERRARLGGTLPLAETLQIADELLDVLAAAHAQGIIHRDIKPGNLFLTKDGHLKVLDFGFAKIKEGMKTESTAVGTLLGTPGFLAPERARTGGDEVDARTDIWSVGATLFRLLSGEHVHDADGPLALLVAAARTPARSLHSVAPSLPWLMVEAIDRALAFDKRDRWSTAQEMREALRDVTRLEEETRVGALPFVSVVVAAEADGNEATQLHGLAAGDHASAGKLLVPRVYDTCDDGSKGSTVLMPRAPGLAVGPVQAREPPTTAPTPQSPQSPAPAIVDARRRPIGLWSLIGVALALVWLAAIVAALR